MELTPKYIKNKVESYYLLDISKKKNIKNYVHTRWLYYKLCHVFLTKYSHKLIASEIKQTHATSIRGVKECDYELTINKNLKRDYDAIHLDIKTSRFYAFEKSLDDLKEDAKNKLENIIKSKEKLLKEIVDNKDNYKVK